LIGSSGCTGGWSDPDRIAETLGNMFMDITCSHCGSNKVIRGGASVRWRKSTGPSLLNDERCAALCCDWWKNRLDVFVARSLGHAHQSTVRGLADLYFLISTFYFLFARPFHFSRVFKQTTGLSPLQLFRMPRISLRSTWLILGGEHLTSKGKRNEKTNTWKKRIRGFSDRAGVHGDEFFLWAAERLHQPAVLTPQIALADYARSACTGLMRVARQAGNKHAITATNPRIATAIVKATGSRGLV
jgi:hypothetical protein